MRSIQARASGPILVEFRSEDDKVVDKEYSETLIVRDLKLEEPNSLSAVLTQIARISNLIPSSPVRTRTKAIWLTPALQKPLELRGFMRWPFAFFRLDLDPGVGSPARPVATDKSAWPSFLPAPDGRSPRRMPCRSRPALAKRPTEEALSRVF